MNEKNNQNILIPSINKEKFVKINTKITNIFKEYHNIIENYSYEINCIENSVNSLKPKYKLKLKNFIDNQQLLIKELVNIINNLLLSIKIHSNKKSSSKNKKSIKSIIESNNYSSLNILKNNNIIKLKTKNQLNGSLSFLNLKNKKKETKMNQYINKPKEKEKEKEKNEIMSKNSSLNNIFSFSTKNKSFLNNSNSLSDINSISNVNASNNNYKKYKNARASSYMKKINNIRLKLSNYNEEKKEIFNTSFFSNKSKKTEKMRKSGSHKAFDKIPISIPLNNLSNMIKNSRSKTVVPLKLTDFSIKKEKIPYPTFNESVSEEKEKETKTKNGILYIFTDNKKTDMKNIEFDGKYHIAPHRMTKEVLNTSYNILNKFEKKEKRKSFLDKKLNYL